MKNDYLKKKIQILVNIFNSKNYQIVISKTINLLKKYPQHIILYNLLGSSYQNIGKQDEAINIFNKGLKIDPKNHYIYNNLGNSYKYILNYQKAEEIFNQLISQNPNYINAYINLANLKRDLNNFAEAINLYEKANKISPNNYLILYLLALAYQGIGNFEKAVVFAKKVLELNPKFTKADYLISQSINYKNNKWHYENLITKSKNNNLNNDEKINIYFSLAKASEDLNNIKESFKFLKKGNELHKIINKYEIDKDELLVENIKKVFKKININSFANGEPNKIIFILGMPRSGTSLLEQILSSHDQIIGGGEMPILPFLIKKNFLKGGLIKNKILLNNHEWIANKLEIKDEYIKYINNFNIDKKYIIDKSPLNFFWIGFIKMLFPGAKIIHCTREPKDNCLSMFKNHFENNLYFTYDEDDLIRFYKIYEELMKFWQFEKEINLINVSYESLVNNSEIEIKRILMECSLNWDEKCLFHHKNQNPIKTMSTAQARLPFYKTSLNSFSKYKNFLAKIDTSF